jgi:hypothetical protein
MPDGLSGALPADLLLRPNFDSARSSILDIAENEKGASRRLLSFYRQVRPRRQIT